MKRTGYIYSLLLILLTTLCLLPTHDSKANEQVQILRAPEYPGSDALPSGSGLLPAYEELKDAPHLSYWEQIDPHSFRIHTSGKRGGGWFFNRDTITLEPGEELTLELRAYQALRISSPDVKITPQDLDVSVSNGSGLFASRSLHGSSKDTALIVEPDRGSNTLLCRIVRPRHLEKNIRLLLSTSITESAKSPEITRNQVEIGDRQVVIDGDTSGRSIMGVMDGLKESIAVVEGPSAIVIEHHLLYFEHDVDRRAEYRIEMQLLDMDGRLQESSLLEFTSLPEQNQILSLNGKGITAGKLERTQLIIPAGRYTLQFIPTRPLVARLLLEQHPAYLFSKLNNPGDHTVSQQLYNRGIFAVEPAWHLWSLQKSILQSTTPSAPILLQTARRLRIDNHHQPGGLTAHVLLHKQAANRPGLRPLLAGNPEVLAPNTFYRTLLPIHKQDRNPPTPSWFITPRLKTEFDRHLILGEQHRNELFTMLGSAQFLALPSLSANNSSDQNPEKNTHFHSFTYVIPPRSAESLLRIVAFFPDETTTLQLRMNNGETVQLTIEPKATYNEDKYRLHLGEAALATLQRRFPRYDRGTLGGPFSLHSFPAPLRPVAFAEITLPQDVTTVEVQQLPGNDQPLHIALQYRDAKFHTLPETDFLNALKQIGGREQLLHRFGSWLVKAINSPDRENATHLQDLAQYDIENEYYPLITYLTSLVQNFTQGVSPPFAVQQTTQTPSSTLTRQLLTQAQSSEQQGQQLVALELYSDMRQHSHGAMKTAATLGHARALEKLGEHYLAELMLKGLYLYPQGKDGILLARTAYEELIRIYNEKNLEEKLLGLYAVEFYRTLYTGLLKPLAGLMAENGDHRYSMLLSLLHPDIEQTADSLLYGALLENWPQLYDETLQQLKNNEDQNYFKALKEVRDGKGDLAEKLLAAGGERGKMLLLARGEARELYSRLQNTTGAEDQIRQQWQEWQATFPGPFVWVKEEGDITDYSGTGILASTARYLFSQYYRADIDKPVTMQVTGPAELRFTVRPLHQPESSDPLTSWIELRDGIHQIIKPINTNFVSQSLELSDGSGNLPGQREVFTYTVAAGKHLLQIRGLSNSLLVQVERKRSALGCEILPPLTEDTFEALRFPSPPAGFTEDKSLRCLVDDCLQLITESEVLSETEAAIRQNIYQNTLLSDISPYAQRESPEETDNSTAPGNTLPTELKKSILTCQENIEQNRQQCLTMLALYSEIAPETEKEWLVTQAQRIYLQDQGQAELGDLMHRNALRSSWQEVELITAEEGLRFVEYTGWQPVSPFLRVRRTLLPPLEENEEILHNKNRLVFSMNSRKATRLKVRMRLLEVPYLLPAPLTVAIESRAAGVTQPQHHITLDSATSVQTFTVEMVPGESQIIFGLQSRYTNQFLAVRIEPVPHAENTPDTTSHLLPVIKKERAYYIASHTHPVQAHVNGPALLRIDQLLRGRLYSSYRYVPEKWQDIVLKPEPEEDQALFRIYRLQSEPHEESEVALLRTPPEPPPGLPPSPAAEVADYPDPLMTEELQTLSTRGSTEIQGKYVSRRNADEDIQSDRQEDFFETSVMYRYYARNIPAHFDTSTIWRLREEGGPVFGLHQGASFYPGFFPATLRLEADLYLQSPVDSNTTLSWPTDEYSLLTRASVAKKYDLGIKWYHIPVFSISKSFLSLDENTAYTDGTVDRDIFTSYKAAHQDGIRIGDTLYHQPWLDTLWHTGLSMGSNAFPDYLIPDNGRFRLGWKQLIGDLQADLTYRGNFYFNDDDRSSSSYKDALQLDVNWDVYTNESQRLQLAGMIRQDLQENSREWFIGLSFHFNDTPKYEHFRTSEVDFKEIKTYRRQQNSAMSRNPAQGNTIISKLRALWP